MWLLTAVFSLVCLCVGVLLVVAGALGDAHDLTFNGRDARLPIVAIGGVLIMGSV